MFASLNNIVVPDPSTLLIPHMVGSYSLLEVAAELYPLVSQHLVPEAVGIYNAQGNLHPIVTPTDFLHLASGKSISFYELGTINEDVYNSKGKVIIPKAKMEKKGTKLALFPQVSKVMIDALKVYLDAKVCAATEWASNIHSNTAFERCFHSTCTSAEMKAAEAIIDRHMKPVVKSVSQMVHDNAWAIYESFLMGSTYTLVRSEDWRVYQWVTQEHDKQHPELYE